MNVVAIIGCNLYLIYLALGRTLSFFIHCICYNISMDKLPEIKQFLSYILSYILPYYEDNYLLSELHRNIS